MKSKCGKRVKSKINHLFLQVLELQAEVAELKLQLWQMSKSEEYYKRILAEKNEQLMCLQHTDDEINFDADF
jgi:hypothetical protein